MKKGKKRNLLIVIASAIVAVFIAVGAAIHANEITSITGLSGSDATVTNSQGQVVDPATLPDDGWTGYNVNYNWSIPDNTNVANGDTATVTLPDGMVVNQDTTGVVKNSKGEVVGTVKFTKGSSTGTITFNDKLAGQYGKHGTLSVTAVKKVKSSASTASGSATGGGSTNSNLTWGINKAGWLDQGAEKNGVPTKIYWDIVINPQGKSLKNVKVTDTIGDGQTYDNGSATFHSVEYHEGQESTRTGTVSGTTSVSGNTITFNLGDIDTPVEIEYETTITNINVNGGNLWSNKATVTTTTPNVKWSRSTDSATVNWGTGGTVQSYAGKIEVTKVDSVDKTKVLPGAVFELENANHQIIKTNLVTGQDGKVTVDDLPDGQYYLVETKAPAGYQLSSTPIQVVISSSNNHTATPVVADKPAVSSSSSSAHQVARNQA